MTTEPLAPLAPLAPEIVWSPADVAAKSPVPRLAAGAALRTGPGRSRVFVIEQMVTADHAGAVYRAWDTSRGEAATILALGPVALGAELLEPVNSAATLLETGQDDIAYYHLPANMPVVEPSASVRLDSRITAERSLRAHDTQRRVHLLMLLVWAAGFAGAMALTSADPVNADELPQTYVGALMVQWITAPIWLATVLLVPWAALLRSMAEALRDLPRLVAAIALIPVLMGCLAALDIVLGLLFFWLYLGFFIVASWLNWWLIGRAGTFIVALLNRRLIGRGGFWGFKTADGERARLRRALAQAAFISFLAHQAGAVATAAITVALPEMGAVPFVAGMALTGLAALVLTAERLTRELGRARLWDAWVRPA